MRLTRHTDFALRILLQAATDPSRQLSIGGVAEAHGISRNHAMKVVNQLARNGFLTTVRGRGGGFRLGRDATQIRLGDVVRLTEPDLAPADCANCLLNEGCGLAPLLGGAVSAFLTELDRHTLADAAGRTRLPQFALTTELPVPSPVP